MGTRLQLKRTALRDLTPADLDGVQGGISTENVASFLRDHSGDASAVVSAGISSAATASAAFTSGPSLAVSAIGSAGASAGVSALASDALAASAESNISDHSAVFGSPS